MKLWVGPIVVSRRLVVDTAAAHSNFRSKQSRVWRVETLQTNVSQSFNPNGQFTGHRLMLYNDARIKLWSINRV
jgi:hypothetical protein